MNGQGGRQNRPADKIRKQKTVSKHNQPPEPSLVSGAENIFRTRSEITYLGSSHLA